MHIVLAWMLASLFVGFLSRKRRFGFWGYFLRQALAIRHVDGCPGHDQYIRGIQVVPVHRPMQRGRPVALGRVDVRR